MRDLTERALEKVRELGASYGDIRVVKRAHEHIGVKNGKVESLSSETEEGFGIRVIADGAWGFASSLMIDPDEIESVADLAVRIARASATVDHEPVELAPVEPAEGSFKCPVAIDPFEVPVDEKIQLLMDADGIMRQTEQIKVAESVLNFWHTDQVFASTEGSYIEQSKTESGVGIAAHAASEGEVQKRSYPADGGTEAQAGYEFVQA
ncbi:MAG: TldD/PmbA family protein, partial [Armatimonadetes bacterium]|nr:TldD/PmbA family protein [Armatimonadota bacterium]